MKRADVKAGVLYAVNRKFGSGHPVMVVKEELWTLVKQRGNEDVWRLAEKGEKPYRDRFGNYRSVEIGLPAMERHPAMMPNPDYVGEEEYNRLYAAAVHASEWTAFRERCQTDTRLQDEIPDPLRWEWRPIILKPRDALAPLDEHEAARQAEQERQNAEREAHRREADDRFARLAAIADVLSLTNTQRRNLMTPPGYNYNGHIAEVTLEWLEEVAGRLRHSAELEEFVTDIGFTLAGDDVPHHLRTRARELMRTRMDVAQGSVSVEVH